MRPAVERGMKWGRSYEQVRYSWVRAVLLRTSTGGMMIFVLFPTYELDTTGDITGRLATGSGEVASVAATMDGLVVGGVVLRR